MKDQPFNIKGKTVLITGGTAGIGKETARNLAQQEARVVVVGRDEVRGKLTVRDIQNTTNNQNIHLLKADLSSQVEVRQLAENFQQTFGELHILINNVAGIFRYHTETVDGIEATFAIGHLAPFLLTHLLLPLLQDNIPARIVNVSSAGHSMAKIDFDDLQAKQFFRGVDIYTRVKLANLMFTYQLARRLEGTGVTVNAVDPGGATTQLTEATTSDMLPSIMRFLYPLLARFTFTSPEKASESSVYAATSPELDGVTGAYINTKFQQVQSSKVSYDQETQEHLWQISADLTGISVSESLAL